MQMRDMAASHAKVVAGDLWYAVRHERTVQIMLGLLVVILVCWDLPYVSTALFPFKLFVTIVHELCHALMARVTGGSIGFIEITPGLEGLTQSYAGSPFNRIMTVMAGYLGTAVFGGLLIWWGRKPVLAQRVLQSTGVAIVLMTLFYGGGSMYSFLWMLGIGLVVVLVARRGSQLFCHMFLLMLAVMTTVQAVDYLRALIILSAGVNGQERRGDALTMETLTGVPAIIWASIWALVSFVVLVAALWISYRPAKAGAISATDTTAAVAAAASTTIPAVTPITTPNDASTPEADASIATANQTAPGDTSPGNTSSGDTSSGDTSSGDTSSGDTSSGIIKTASVPNEEALSRTMDPEDEERPG